ncbi:MAG TPA: hypothetical protein VGP64_11525 [Polyangia bacterium]
MRRASSLGCALLAGALATAACQQTWNLDDLGPDASHPGTGGASGNNGGKGGFSPSDGSIDGRCFGQVQPIIATGDRPLVVVALDRSSEMTGTQLSGSNDSQFDEAVNDLIAQVGSYAPSGQHMNRRTIDFAYLGFPQGTTCGPAACCASTADLADSYSAFSAATATCDSPSNMCVQSTNHPLSNALMSASNFFEFGSGGSPASERYVLVITDDAPSGNCSSVSTEDDCHAAQDEVFSLYQGLSVTTVVVFVGNSQSNSCFQNFAGDQGGGPPPYYGDDNLYYDAQGAQDLHDRIGTAIQAMAWGACHFSLSSMPSSPNNLVVSQGQGQGATPIPQDSKNGWTYDNENGSTGPRLVLHGNACSNYVMSEFGNLQVSDGCSTNHGPTP